jgi:5-formyltetrahydrofolate cyclo-ligase
VHDIDKGTLRRRQVAARTAMPDSIRNESGRLIRDHVLEMPQVTSAGTIAAYYSVGTEPDTRGLIFALWKRGSYVVLPVLLPDGDLDWASYEGPESLAPGPRGAGRGRARPAARAWRRVVRQGAGPGGTPGADDRAAI